MRNWRSATDSVVKSNTPRLVISSNTARSRSTWAAFISTHAIALEVQARMAFSLHKDLKNARIEIEAWKKELRLSGSVDSAEQRRLALETASELTGVSSVTDRLEVAGQDGDREARRTAAERAIRSNANLKAAAIKVRLDGATVVLEGRVRTGAERDLAALLAREAAGPKIRNALEIRQKPE